MEEVENWRVYLQTFVFIYKRQDTSGILALMEPSKTDQGVIYAKAGAVKALFKQEYGLDFILAKGKHSEVSRDGDDGMRKVEVRFGQPAYGEYFAAHLSEIQQRIKEIGGTYDTTSPETVINCSFAVHGEREVQYQRIFEMFEQFVAIILDYYTREV